MAGGALQQARILEAYLNLAPMGGNIEGAEAASRIYFGKSATQLSLSEALALAVIPQQPGRRARFGPPLQQARQRLMADWRETYPQDPRNDSLLDLPLEARNRQQIPFLAPHLSEQLLASQPGNELNSTLNLPLQQLLERLIYRLHRRTAQHRCGKRHGDLDRQPRPKRQGTGRVGGLLITITVLR